MVDFQLAAGSLFGNRFEIDRPAGRGGMGVVYRARDRYSGDWVALKLLHDGAKRPSESERFVREAQLLAELRHPGIVAYVGHGQTPDGQRYLVMEWLDGESLAQRLDRGPLQLSTACQLLQRLTEALAFAHQRGVIHRDLKPTNLFLPGGDLDRVKLLDFGIARRVATTTLTRSGQVIGTPAYMAPEQARGADELTAAADIFSLGCIFYECLTGAPPFVADHLAAVLVRILFENPMPVEQRRPGIPASVSELLARMLDKDAGRRIADAAELRRALTGLGSVPELPSLPTLTAPVPASSPFAEQEQVLFSLVLAAAPSSIDSAGATGSSAPAGPEVERRASLLSALRAMGVRADYLAGGELIATVPQTASALDQATLAARVGLLVKERWPEAAVTVATGRGTVQGTRAVGEVADRAARLLAQRTDEKTLLRSGRVYGVLLDELSARLLGPVFSIAATQEGGLLLGEEREADPSRRLLGKPTPCVGREGELAMLEAQLRSCIEESEARVVRLTAPPGVGKSRLRHEFLRRIAQHSAERTLLQGFGDLMSAGAPYGVLGEAVQRLCGLRGGEPLFEQRAGLHGRLGRHLAPGERQRVVEFLGELCTVPFPDDESPALRAARQDPTIMQSQIRRAFLDWLRAECEAAPVLLIFDDLHWGDALTVMLIDHALRALAGAPLFILGLGRPEIHELFPKLWHGHKLQEIVLKGLSKRACERLILQALGKGISASLTARLIEQSAGNALFLEELIRATAEGRCEDLPDTVLAMLQARIGRLNPGARRAIRAASIYGQTFWEGGVAALLGAELMPPELHRWLRELTDAEIIESLPDSRLKNEREYRFRHVLLREATYSLLTDSDRATGHLLAGTFLEAAGETDPMVIAEHYQRSGKRDRALVFLTRAAEQALDAYDMAGVMRWVEHAVACGAQGNDLGKLRSMECFAHLIACHYDKVLPAGREAIDLLTPGSSHWCMAIRVMFARLADDPEAWKAHFSDLFDRFNRATPERDAVAAYTGALAYLICVFVWAAQLEPAHALRARLQRISDPESKNDPIIQRWVLLADSSLLRYCEPKPWSSLQAAKEGIAAAKSAGDLWTQGTIQYYHAMTLYELGDAGGAERSLLAEQELWDRPVDDAMYLLMEQSICYLWSDATDSERLREVGERTESFVQRTRTMPWCCGYAILARIKLKQGDAEAAETLARKGCDIMAPLPIYGLVAFVALVYALLARGRTQEALLPAEEGLQRIKHVGCAGYAEVAMRLAASEAFHAAGDTGRARAELRETLRQIQLRVADIPEPFWQDSYLTRNPDNVRAHALARAWGL